MKKLCLILLSVFMLVGCSQSKSYSTFMITKDQKTYALYNQNGKKLTDYLYTDYEEVKDTGFIVTNDKKQKGFISLKGEEIIPFGEYETLEAVNQMLYATKAVKKETTKKKIIKKKPLVKRSTTQSQFVYENLYVLNGKGEVLYTASKDTAINKTGLPLIYKDKKYIILYQDGQTLLETNEKVTYATQYNDAQYAVIGTDKTTYFYTFDSEDNTHKKLDLKTVGQYQIMTSNEFMSNDESVVNSAILYDKNLKNLIYVNATDQKFLSYAVACDQIYYDDNNNIILKNNKHILLYVPGQTAIELTTYYYSGEKYLVRSQKVYGPHTIYKNQKKQGQLKNCQLYPVAQLISSEIFPVYTKTGYQYYNFDGKKVIDKVYLEASPFDKNQRAVVKEKKEGYTLINDAGVSLTNKVYENIQYIGSSYYAVYNKEGIFGIIDVDAKEILPVEYTTLPESPIVKYNNTNYLILGKNGRSYVYDIEDNMKEIFSIEGEVILSEKGYFSVGQEYYTFDGEKIN